VDVDIRGVVIVSGYDGAVIARISIHELQSAESTASRLRNLLKLPWITLELFAETLDRVCAVLNVR
jgi:hypothetical protein